MNYFGPLTIAQAFRDTPALKSGGAVINVLSFLAFATVPRGGTYSASKAAGLALTRTLRAELKSRGTQVLAVFPVQVDTPMGAGTDRLDVAVEHEESDQMLAGLGQAEFLRLLQGIAAITVGGCKTNGLRLRSLGLQQKLREVRRVQRVQDVTKD